MFTVNRHHWYRTTTGVYNTILGGSRRPRNRTRLLRRYSWRWSDLCRWSRRNASITLTKRPKARRRLPGAKPARYTPNSAYHHTIGHLSTDGQPATVTEW